MERPGLKRLLADIDAGQVDIVVVYKVDRLTRSLADFARIVELFDRHGRLVRLRDPGVQHHHVDGAADAQRAALLAQFEREVTGERIRDKIAASKAKGMWMGGNAAARLRSEGPDPSSSTRAEAALVRDIFTRYLELGSVHAARPCAYRATASSPKQWTAATGRGPWRRAVQPRGPVPSAAQPLYSARSSTRIKSIQASIPASSIRRCSRRFKRASPATRSSAVPAPSAAPRSPACCSMPMAIACHRPTRATGMVGIISIMYPHRSCRAALPGRIRFLRISAMPVEDALLERLRRWSARSEEVLAELLRHVKRVVLHREFAVVDLVPPAHEDWTARLEPEESWIQPDDVLQIRSPLRLCARGGRTWLVSADASAGRPRPDRALIAGLRRRMPSCGGAAST